MTAKRLAEIEKMMLGWFDVLEWAGDYHLGPNEKTVAIREMIAALKEQVHPPDPPDKKLLPDTDNC